MLTNKLTGAGAADKTYIEDVFSTYLYTGDGLIQTINNGIDLAGKGGMVWIKSRSSGSDHGLYDTARNPSINIQTAYRLRSNTSDGQTGVTDDIRTWLTNGFRINDTPWSSPSTTYASWTFRKAPKFFDVVTYTGNGDANRQINHSLGSEPGMVIIKRTDSTGAWAVWHRRTGISSSIYGMSLNTTSLAYTYGDATGKFTSTIFTPSYVQDENAINPSNINGATYVAYLFAHDTTADGLIQCGSFTSDSSGNASVNLGWEPQYLMFKRTDSTGQWYVLDTMRGYNMTQAAPLYQNLANAESATGWSGYANPTATGFEFVNGAFGGVQSYIYMAIRRGPMRTPTDGTKVYNTQTFGGGGTAPPAFIAGFPVDLGFYRQTNGTYDWVATDRLRGTGELNFNLTNAESANTVQTFDYQNGYYNSTGTYSQYRSWMLRRAPGFFDVVCYTGTLQMPTTVSHNLKVAPELIIIKNRYYGQVWSDWFVYAAPLGANKLLYLNKTDAAVTDNTAWFNTIPTATQFKVDGYTSLIHEKAVAYLFASCPGVSKVFSFTGNGSSQTINCGFTNGARLVLIKRTDSTGDWYIWDTARGIVAATDPHLSLNTTAAEVTTDDTIDPESTGFIVNQVSATNVNVNGASYIGLAIA